MPVVHEGLETELAYVENPDEQRHIRALWDEADPVDARNLLPVDHRPERGG